MRWATTAGLVLALCASAQAQTYAPLNGPDPKLSVPKKELAAALECNGVNQRAPRKPVLLVPGTTVDPDTNFDWNYVRAFEQRRIPYCKLRSPGDAMADVQLNGEHVVFAIRRMHQRTGRRVSIVGHSQGGMVPRWALRFWPSTRKLVDDLVGMAASNHGTPLANGICTLGGCAPAIWQQRDDSAFIAALNSRTETFAGISYTSVYTRYDGVVVPNFDESGSTSLRTGKGLRTNVATQDICPTNNADHISAGTYDPVVYALAIDALTHKGPADPNRIDPAVCGQSVHEGVEQASFAENAAAAYDKVATTLATYPRVDAEPPLAPYVTKP